MQFCGTGQVWLLSPKNGSWMEAGSVGLHPCKHLQVSGQLFEAGLSDNMNAFRGSCVSSALNLCAY